MSQTPSILLERDKSHSNEMLAQTPCFASAVQLELSGNGDSDAVFDVLPVVVEAQKTLRSHGSFCNVVLRTYRCVHEVGFLRLQRQLHIRWMGAEHP